MRILLHVALSAVVFGTAVDAQTRLELRLAEKEPATGLVESVVSRTGEKVYLHETSVITNEDIRDARVVPAGDDAFNVAISFTLQGAAKMAAATQAHVGRPLAIVVNGAVLTAPTVRSPIRQDTLITGDLTRQQAEEIVAGLTAR
jgi:preprotein translocase subunit SecD